MTSLLPDEGEHLEDGWSPGLAAEDSIVRQAVTVHAEWAIALARSVGGPWHDDDRWAGGCSTEHSVFSNWVIVKQPHADPLAVAEEAVDRLGRAPFVLIDPWPARDLSATGLELLGHPPLMLRPAGRPTEAPNPELEVSWVENADQLAVAERLLIEGYPLPELQPFTPGSVYPPALLDVGARFVVVSDGERPLATAAAHPAAGLTLVEGVAALPGERGRRAGATAAWAATNAVDGLPAVLLASDDGQPVYRRLGYLRLERWTAWLHVRR